MTISRKEAWAQLTAPGAVFEIAHAEVRGIDTKVWKNAPPTLAAIVTASRAFGDRKFVVYEDESMTFEEHYSAVARFAAVLSDGFGVRKGDRVAIAMRNFPEWSVAFWAAAAAGAVVVPLNTWWTGDELAYGLADSGAKVVVLDSACEERLEEEWGGLKDLEAVIVVREARGPLAASPATSPAASAQAGRPKDGSPRLRVTYEEALAGAGATSELPAVQISPDDDATIFYTSGTTGRPKGALGTHRNICTNPMSLLFATMQDRARHPARAAGSGEAADGPQPGAPAANEGQEEDRNVYLLSVPLFHATGCHSILVTNLLVGGTLVMMYRWDAGRALQLIEREKVTTFGGVPAMVMQVLDHPDFEKADTSSVRNVGYGGAPAPKDLVRRIGEHFPLGSPSNGYGMTETSSVATMNRGEDYVAKPDSVGPPVPVVDVKVVDPKGETVPVGEVGELWIKGPNIVKGYWHKPEATAQTFSDGWVHTGDIAHLDEEGFVFIVDRAKDMLIRGGENIYCVEIEDVLYDHPAVADAAVIGIPHPVLGEEVGAVVQIRSGFQTDSEALRDHVAGRLASFKVPVRVWVVDEPLPRNPAGKILKRQLRDALLAEPA